MRGSEEFKLTEGTSVSFGLLIATVGAVGLLVINAGVYIIEGVSAAHSADRKASEVSKKQDAAHKDFREFSERLGRIEGKLDEALRRR